MRWLRLLFLFISLPAWANTCVKCYVSAGGSDSNSGATKLLSWAHLPGMVGATGNAASQVPVAGDSYILKGGDTWGNASFPITWSWSGSAGNVITIGVDKTWYTGGSWSRPIWDGGGTPIGGTYNEYIRAISDSYLTWDNIEMTGLNWRTSYSFGQLTCAYFGGSNHIVVSNWYVHGWSHTNGVTSDGFQCIVGNVAYNMDGNLIIGVVYDGSDSTGGGDSSYFTYQWPSVTNSVCHDVPNCLLPTTYSGSSESVEIGGNLIYNIKADFDGVTHANAIEVLGPGTYYIHDNVIHDVALGYPLEWGSLAAAQTAYVWNNVIWNVGLNYVTVDARSGSSTGYVFNNTFLGHSGTSVCIGYVTGSAYSYTVNESNNHCITTSTLDNFAADGFATVTRTTNLTQTPTAAAAQGYTSSSTYAYSPPAGGSTINAGTNLTSSWPGGYSTSDTSYANTRTQVARPASGTWDIGAYRFQGGTPAAGTTATAGTVAMR